MAKRTKKKTRDESEGESAAYDSDALDDDFEEKPRSKKRQRSQSGSPSKRKTTKRRKAEASEDSDFELKDGQEIVGSVLQAPAERAPAGQISKYTLDFLQHLKNPDCNDREWFKLHEPLYRAAEQEWKDFVETFTDDLANVDRQIPHLPPRDLIHRIYRDVRFSNDKTPYKTGLSASFSRSGRKGIFAGYHVMIKPGHGSIIAAGSWCPQKNELATIRSNILRNSSRLRNIITAPDFVKFFGEAKPHKSGERQNIFGHDDELKVAPKGVAKDHPDIDLLKCRSFAVFHRFTDSEVVASDFRTHLADVARIMQPLVHCMNELMTLRGDESDDEE